MRADSADLADSAALPATDVRRESGFGRSLSQTSANWRTHRQLFWGGLLIALIAISLSPLASGFADQTRPGGGDLALYQAEVARMAAGEKYYDAAAAELTARGYPSKSVFNWRTPLPMAIIAALGLTGSRVLLGSVAVLLLSFAAQSLVRGGHRAGIFAAIFVLSGVIWPIFLETALFLPEVWSGILLGLSLAAYGCDRRITAVAAGLCALVFRELAAPYVLFCAVWAWRKNRRGEAAVWVFGMIAYLLFYAAHLAQVLPRIESTARAHGQSWLALGGAAFVISLAQMNVWLLMLPQWVSAAALVGAAAGWSTARSEWEDRVAWTGAIYVSIFAFVGMPINQYWGAMFSPVIALGLGMLPRAISQLNSDPQSCYPQITRITQRVDGQV